MLGVPLALKVYEVIGNELALKWEDGSEGFLPLRNLRLACPCAVCTGERDLLQKEHRLPQSPPPLRSESFVLTKIQPVGGYALRPTWGDGHDTGIFSFAYLRSLPREEA